MLNSQLVDPFHLGHIRFSFDEFWYYDNRKKIYNLHNNEKIYLVFNIYANFGE